MEQIYDHEKDTRNMERIINLNSIMAKERMERKTLRDQRVRETAKKVAQTKRRVIGATSSALAAVLLITGISSKDIIKRVMDANDAREIITEDATEELAKRGVIYTDEKGKTQIKRNFDDGLYSPTLGELYAYKLAFAEAGDHYGFRFEEFVTNTYYTDHNQYISLDQMYNINGLYDQDHNPSGLEFNKYSMIEIMNAYYDGTIDNIVTKQDTQVKGK